MKKVILLILDGFGIRDTETGNVIKMSNLPNITEIMNKYSVSKLLCSAENVGLPKNVVGNSEAGHITIGAGRVVKQPYTIINESIIDKSFFENDHLLDLMDHVKDNKSKLHLIGLLSSSGSHSSIEHFYATLALAKKSGLNNVVFHFITDGCDEANNAAIDHMNSFMEKSLRLGLGTVGTISGRYYAMNSDGNYDRVKKAYDALVYGLGNKFSDYQRCLDLHYKNNITDEYINPSIIAEGSNIEEGDAVLFVDFRPERIDELVSSFVDPTFNMFSTKKFNNVKFMSLYSTSDKIEGAYTNEVLTNTFGKYLADLGFKQARISEMPRYQQVTYFFDGAEEFSDKNMYKMLIPSPNIPRFDMKPEMNIAEVTTTVLNSMDEDYDFIVANFCNPDIVGHTGNLPAIVRALEACDICVGKILEKAQENFYQLAITSDHGNIECMKDDEGNITTGHTFNPVPFVVCDEKIKLKEQGTLADVIPTIIDIFEISKPKEMTGNSLLEKEN